MQMADILIKGGLVVDGSGKPGFVGDVAVTRGKIEAVGPNLAARADRVIDPSGKVVIPGLIDPHVHEEYVCLLDGRLFWSRKELTLYLEAGNLFNTSYYDYGGILQPGRWLRAGIRIQLDRDLLSNH